jgi:hypothetical protein
MGIVRGLKPLRWSQPATVNSVVPSRVGGKRVSAVRCFEFGFIANTALCGHQQLTRMGIDLGNQGRRGQER